MTYFFNHNCKLCTMEHKYIQLKKATHQRLLAINDEIRISRKNKKDIKSLVQYRKSTNSLLNKIDSHIARKNYCDKQYEILKYTFLKR